MNDERQPFRLQIEIPGLPSLNAAANNHWRVRQAENKAWKARVSNAVLVALGRWPSAPLQRARVVLTRCSTTEPDADNLASSFKFILDGLVMASVIADDKPSVIDAVFQWERAPRGAGCVRVRVEALPDQNGVEIGERVPADAVGSPS